MAPRQKLSYVDDAVSVGRRLRAAREQAGISQRALSFPGCTAAYISRIENGERIPSLQLLREFAARLNVGEQYLAYGRDELPVSRTTPTEARVAIRMGDFATARELASAGLDEARSNADRAAAFSLLGEIALAEGELGAARAALERASALDPAIEERDPRTAESLGRMYARAFEYESAAAVFERNRDRAIADGDPINEVRFASLLANVHIDAGNFGIAEEALAGAIRASETVAEPLTVARMFWSQSRLHSHQQDPVNAARYAERALELLEASDQYYDIARCHQLLAHIELERGNNELAADLLERAAPTIAASGRKFELASFRIEQARVLLKANRREEAGAVAMQASAELADQSPVDAGRSYALLASVFVDLGDDARAIELYELAIEHLAATPNRWLVDAYSKLAELHERRGDQDAMIEALKRGMSVQRQADRLLAER
jgi:tetratricopeptide (TPR) repeat protein